MPSFVFFIVFPLSIRSVAFWPALLIACAATAVSYGAWVWVARRLGSTSETGKPVTPRVIVEFPLLESSLLDGLTRTSIGHERMPPRRVRRTGGS